MSNRWLRCWTIPRADEAYPMMPAVTARLSATIRNAVIAALVLGALLLLAFGPRAGDAYPSDCVIVDYWEHWSGDEEAAMRQIVDAFNRTIGRDKKIFVRYLSTSAIEQKTLVSTAAGAPPDIAGLYNQNIPQFAALDALEPLDNMAVEKGITPETYKRVFWDELSYDGHLYGLVSSAFDLGLYYNKQIFRENAEKLRAAGLDPERAPRTIAELDAYAAAIDRRDASGNIEVAGYLPLEPGWYQNYTCIWFGGSWWDRQNKKFTFTSPGVVRAYEWIQGYSKRHGPGAETGFRSGMGSYDSPQNSFLAGRVSMVLQGTFLENVIRNQKPSMAGQWGAAPFPSYDPSLKNVTYCNCDVRVIPRGAKHKREAFEFMAFANQQRNMEQLASLHGKISPLAQVSEKFFTNHPNPYIRVFDELAASPNAHPTEPVPILPEVNAEMNNFVQRLALLEVTPQQGLLDMQRRLQKKYDDFMAEQRERRRLSGRE
jgi:ABC-type glycerol-3-phosphate transport system substrate-binding protein